MAIRRSKSESEKPSLFGSKGFDTGMGTPRLVKIWQVTLSLLHSVPHRQRDRKALCSLIVTIFDIYRCF